MSLNASPFKATAAASYAGHHLSDCLVRGRAYIVRNEKTDGPDHVLGLRSNGRQVSVPSLNFSVHAEYLDQILR